MIIIAATNADNNKANEIGLFTGKLRAGSMKMHSMNKASEDSAHNLVPCIPKREAIVSIPAFLSTLRSRRS